MVSLHVALQKICLQFEFGRVPPSGRNGTQRKKYNWLEFQKKKLGQIHVSNNVIVVGFPYK